MQGVRNMAAPTGNIHGKQSRRRGGGINYAGMYRYHRKYHFVDRKTIIG